MCRATGLKPDIRAAFQRACHDTLPWHSPVSLFTLAIFTPIAVTLLSGGRQKSSDKQPAMVDAVAHSSHLSRFSHPWELLGSVALESKFLCPSCARFGFDDSQRPCSDTRSYGILR